jgi:GNAT superfamily N-acetyltransferase
MSLLNSSSLVSLLRDCLADFPLYDKSHFVQSHEMLGQIDAQYSSHPFLASLNFTGVELHVCVRGETGYVAWIRIPKELRGKGHGSELIACAEQFFRKAGCSEVELTASGENKRVFYEKLGYFIISEVPVVMRKSL